MSRSGHPRQPRPSYHGRGVGRLLDTETSSPRELDENAVIDLLVPGALAALDHEDQLLLMAEVGEYPRGDSRLLHEDVDYPYVVGQIVLSDDGQEVAVDRSGRGWVNVAADELMRAQRT